PPWHLEATGSWATATVTPTILHIKFPSITKWRYCSAASDERRHLMLHLPPFRYLAPRTLDEAVQMLAQEGEQAMLVAGGTDLYPNMKRRQFTPPVLVGLRGIASLKGISGSPEEGLQVGAGTTLTTLAEHPLIQQHYSALAIAA